jgi:hypothetical protein
MDSPLSKFELPANLLEKIEFAGQLHAWVSYVQLIDTTQNALPRRISEYNVPTDTTKRRSDPLERSALGRKRRIND